MEPFNFTAFIQSLIDAKSKFLGDCNNVLKTLPPIEQHEATSIVGYAVRELTSAIQWITTTCVQMDTQLKDYIARAQEIIADCNSKFVAAQIEKGELIPKSRIEAGDYLSREVAQQNCQAAAEAAATARETEVVTRIQLLASRRVELYQPKVGADGKEVPGLLSREVVDKLPDELLKADDYLVKAQLIASRLGEVQALGVSVPQLLARAYELPLDDGGTTQFQEQLSMIKTAVGDTAGKPKPGGSGAPLALGSGTQNLSHELEGVF